MGRFFCISVWVACSILWITTPPCRCQGGDNNWNEWEPWNNKPVTNEEEYFMDKQTECMDVMREVGDKTSMVYGHGSVKTDAGPLSCKLTLNTDSPRNPKRFRLEVTSASIRDQDVHFFIYDGNDGSNGGQILDTFNYNKGLSPNYDYLYTTGGRVTFLLTRRHEENFQYDISVRVTPIPASIIDGTRDDCTSGDQFGCYDYYRFQYKFPNEAVVGIVGGVFALCLVIVAVISLCCYRKYSGKSKRWTEAPLSFINTGASLPSTNGTLRNTNTRPSTGWDKSSRHTSLPPKSRMIRPSEDADSVFESVDSLPIKKRWSPPQRREPERSLPRTSTKRTNRRAREDPEFDDMETSFVQGDDDHPQSVFVERVIEPRVKPTKKKEYYDDSPLAAVKFPKHMTTTGTDPGSEEEESDEEEEDTEVETDQEESDVEPVETSSQPPIAPPVPAADIPQQSALPPQTNTVPMPMPPGVVGQGYPPRPLPLPGPQPMYRGNFAPPTYNQVLMGEGRPVQPGPNQFQPVHRVPHPMRYPVGQGYIGQPSQQQEPQPPPLVMNTNNQPMYSYIVQRGYMPQGGRHSPQSSSVASNLTDRRIQTDESDFGVNLDSGVELMKRHTEV
ncbi:hypothetical protein ScPMuIL_008493 [Solemya velum]